MNRLRKQINNLLATHGGELVRVKKHRVFHFPDGKQYVEASTPSSQDSDQKELAKLKRILEIPKEEKPKALPREKKQKPTAPKFLKQTLIKSSTQAQSFSEKLASERTKLLEDELLMNQIEVLNSEIFDLQADVQLLKVVVEIAHEYISLLEAEIQKLEAKTCLCLLCKIKGFCSRSTFYFKIKPKTQPRSHKNQDSNRNTFSHKGGNLTCL